MEKGKRKKSLERLVLNMDRDYLIRECLDKFKSLSFASQQEINHFRDMEYHIKGKLFRITIQELKNGQD